MRSGNRKYHIIQFSLLFYILFVKSTLTYFRHLFTFFLLLSTKKSTTAIFIAFLTKRRIEYILVHVFKILNTTRQTASFANTTEIAKSADKLVLDIGIGRASGIGAFKHKSFASFIGRFTFAMKQFTILLFMKLYLPS